MRPEGTRGEVISYRESQAGPAGPRAVCGREIQEGGIRRTFPQDA
jgi:hypothetical protein